MTGSARLDWYRYGGDSLQGRYHYLRLHPFSCAELGSTQDTVYRERLLRDDVQGVEALPDLGRMELLMQALPHRVGSPLSLNALRADLQISHPTLARWLDVFERVYAIFRVPLFGAPRLRAVKKEQKHYHYDWTLVQADGPRTRD